MKIRYSKDAIKFLGKQTKKTVERIRDAISKLTLNPPEGDIATVQGYSGKRLRVGSWRIIYKHITEGYIEVLIIDIGNRGDVYK